MIIFIIQYLHRPFTRVIRVYHEMVWSVTFEDARPSAEASTTTFPGCPFSPLTMASARPLYA